MAERDLERLLGEAFDARARGAVGDHTPVPPLPDLAGRPDRPRRSSARLLAPLAAAAAVVAAIAVAAVVSGRFGAVHPSAATSAPAAVSRPAAPTTPVSVRLNIADGAVVGVGMPVVADFSAKITDARALQRSTHATANGKPLQVGWYFVRSSAHRGYPLEGHLRPDSFWPAHAKIAITVDGTGLPAGGGRTLAGEISLHFETGAADIATVSAATDTLTLTRDGKQVVAVPVSLGAAATPTRSGVKVISAKFATTRLSGPGYADVPVHYAQRLSDSGEYLLAAPWNVTSRSTSGGTELTTAAARRLFSLLRVGDVVRYPDAPGPTLAMGDGYADWNVPWPTWLTGGLVPTR